MGYSPLSVQQDGNTEEKCTLHKPSVTLAVAFWVFFPLQRTDSVGTSNADFPSGDPGMYQLDVTLRRGQNLAARDRGGKCALGSDVSIG